MAGEIYSQTAQVKTSYSIAKFDKQFIFQKQFLRW